MSPLAHALLAVSLLLPVSAVGAPRQHQPILIETQQSPLLLVANKRNLTEGVTAVIHPRGEFRKVGPNRWSENNGTFKFREVKDNGRTITLYDKSRDMFVYLNLRQEMIRWALNGDEPQDLYKIIGVIREDADVGKVHSRHTAWGWDCCPWAWCKTKVGGKVMCSGFLCL